MDIDMTKKCAELMGFGFVAMTGTDVYVTPPGESFAIAYDPLNNDAQAMALVKKLRLFIDPDFGMPDVWQVASETNSAVGEDLNHAIVECVSKMVKP